LQQKEKDMTDDEIEDLRELYYERAAAGRVFDLSEDEIEALLAAESPQ
jgi:hypothetical protein